VGYWLYDIDSGSIVSSDQFFDFVPGWLTATTLAHTSATHPLAGTPRLTHSPRCTLFFSWSLLFFVVQPPLTISSPPFLFVDAPVSR
jgi:hypothetical protein